MSYIARTNIQEKQARYAENGMFGGALVGMLSGLLYSGPNFYEWPFVKTIAIVVGLTIAGGLLGYAFFRFAHVPGVVDISNDPDHSDSDVKVAAHGTNSSFAEHDTVVSDDHGSGYS